MIKTSLFITDVALWPRANATYAAYFGAHQPARSIVPVGPLHDGFLVEREAVAARGP